MSATAPFTPATLTFLRALKRNTNRVWFLERKADYERDVQRPMQLVIERLGREFESFAPEQMADPKKSLYRIWRDTRFSGDKRPLKTNVAAVFPHRRGTRHTSAGFYIEIEAKWVFAGGGLYMPEPASLQRIREQIAKTPAEFRSIVTSEPLMRLGGVQGECLKRVPRGFPSDHPAADDLKRKQFLAFKEWPPELMTSPQFWDEVLPVFRAIAPLVLYLNTAMKVGSG